jgi:hypothetical protein
MDRLKDILWPIVLVGGLGALIDFLLGKSGQDKARDCLLKWWMRFDDVRWNNFGREEGLFAARTIEKWCGKYIWSLRRLLMLFIACLINIPIYFLVLPYISEFYGYASVKLLSPFTLITCYLCDKNFYFVIIVLMTCFFGFSLSVSVTKFMAFRMAYICGVGKFRNFIIFFIALGINLALFVAWTPLATLTRESFLIGVEDNWFHTKHGDHIVLQLLQQMTESDNFVLGTLPLLTGLFRLIISIVFVGSFVLRPLVMRPVSLVWARIVESDKPVFTLIFGGAAAFATAISEAAKHLSG